MNKITNLIKEIDYLKKKKNKRQKN